MMKLFCDAYFLWTAKEKAERRRSDAGAAHAANKG